MNNIDKTPIDVCLVMNDFSHGGAERLVKDLSSQFVSISELNVTVVVSNERGDLKPEFDESDIDIVSLGIDVSPTTIPAGVRKLTQTLDDLNVDIVHSHLAFSDLISRISCLRLSIPHVSTYHNLQQERSAGKRLVEKVSRGISRQIICVSDGVRESYNNGPNMEVVYNAIDVEEFNREVEHSGLPETVSTYDEGDTVCVNIARCAKVKRQDVLIEAMAQLDSDDIHLFIVGDGPRRQLLERKVTELGVSDTVTVTGYVDDIEPYYAIADVFVSSSSSEGLPTTHIEAMAAELPVISTDIPGVREIVDHGENGYLYPVDDATELAAYINRIQDETQRSLGDRGYETAHSEFSIDQMTTDHLALYATIIS